MTKTTDPLPPVTIRRATRADAEVMLHLINALAEFEKLDPPDKERRARLVHDAFCERPRFEVYLGEVDGKAVGYAFVFETYSSFLALPTLYLEDVFVLPEYRGYKAGLALFRHCVAEARRRGCGRMEWVTLDWNTRAQDLWISLGARRLNEWFSYRLEARQFDHVLAEK